MKRYSVISKAIALILLLAFSLVTITGLVGGIYLYDYGFFTNNGKGWLGTASFTDKIEERSWQAAYYALSGRNNPSIRWELSREATNYRYIVYDLDTYKAVDTNLEHLPTGHIRGENLGENLINAGIQVYGSTQLGIAHDETSEPLESAAPEVFSETETLAEEAPSEEPAPLASGCLVESFIDASLPVEDDFSRYVSFYVNHRDLPMVSVAAVVLGCLFCLGLLIYLFYVCGHRPGVEGIILNPLDRIPLDAYAFLLMSLGVCGVALLVELFYYRGHWWWDAIGIGTSAYLIAGLLLAFLLSCATRAKAGVLWGNSLIGRFLHGCIRLIRWLGQAIPMTWQVLGGTGLVLFLLYLLAARRATLLLFFLELVLFVLVALFTWNLRQLEKAGAQLAAGNTELTLECDRILPPLRRHSQNLTAISKGIDLAVEQRLKSERLKTELITNVSHDIKTPLTSIINYVDLLQKEELPDTAAEYVETLARQSARLKKLTEDVLEASKASTGNIEVNLQPTDLGELLNQVSGEYQERLEEGGLTLVQSLSGSLIAPLDGRLMWRILDNLLSNTLKYALPGTRVYLDARPKDGTVLLSVKNISRDSLNISADELMERFVQGDASRSSEGSGLGLNIARSLTELQGGTMSLTVDGDLFKAELAFPAQ